MTGRRDLPSLGTGFAQARRWRYPHLRYVDAGRCTLRSFADRQASTFPTQRFPKRVPAIEHGFENGSTTISANGPIWVKYSF